MTPSPLDPALARFPTTEPGHGAPPLQRTTWRSLLRTGYTPHQAEAILDWLARGEWVEQLAYRPSVAAGCTNAGDMSCAELPVPFIPRAVLMSKKTATHFDIKKVLLSPKRELTIVFHNTAAIACDFDAWVIGPVAPRQTPAGDKPARPPWTVCHGGIGHGSCYLSVQVRETARLVHYRAGAEVTGSNYPDNYPEECRLTGPLVPKVFSSGMRIEFIVEVPGDFDRNFAVVLSWEPLDEGAK